METMKLTSDRRTFLKKALTGAAGITGLGVLESKSFAGSKPGKNCSDINDEERKKLIAEAYFGRKVPASSKKGMVICSHPLATRDGVKILKNGGNACDAALCTAVAQTVLEPHMTGITGVLGMLYYDAASGETTYVNGTMNAPLEPLGRISGYDLSTGRGVGVPGFWAAFEASHKRHGSKPIKEIMRPAIRYARDGFEIHPFLWGQMHVRDHLLGLTEEGREIYMAGGALPRPGEKLYQKRSADFLEQLAEEGSDFYYRGGFAKNFCKVVQDAGGVITMKDMEAYRARWQEPARGTYREYEIAASPPPDNGGTNFIEALNIFEIAGLNKLGPPAESPEALELMVRIHNEVLIEGANYRDPESHPLPLELILSKEYAETRYKLLRMGKAKKMSPPPPPVGSCHVTAMDAAGNMATLLHSCMSYPWDNGLFVRGVSIVASASFFTAAMPKPGCRSYSPIVPNIIFKNKKPVLASGSPSMSLLASVLQNTVNILDFGMSIEESVHRPRFGRVSSESSDETNLVNEIEADFPNEVKKQAQDRGLRFRTVSPWNRNHGTFEGIYIDHKSGMMHACGDPRRCSKAEGI